MYNPCIVGIEWRGVSPKELINELEQTIRLQRESKYAYQTGLKNLDFEVDRELLTALGLKLPLTTVDQSEAALRHKAIQPSKFLEYDDTEHRVLIFDYRPIGYSGFMDCVTHSLALTDRGLFEVGRYPAVNLSSQSRHWAWFLHRRLVSAKEVADWQESQQKTSTEFMETIYQAMVNT